MTRLRTGPWGQNCYLVRRGRDAVLVDPGGGAETILRAIDDAACTVHAVLLTHGHFDHVGAVEPVATKLAAPVFMSSADAPVLRQAKMLQFVFKSAEPVRPPRTWIDLGQEEIDLSFGDLLVRGLPTPGHTPGGFTFLTGSALLTGDTLLAGKVGTAKLPGGDAAALDRSVESLFSMPASYRVFPGHGDEAPLDTYVEAAAR